MWPLLTSWFVNGSEQAAPVHLLGIIRQTKVALKCNSEEELLLLQAKASSLNLCARSIRDAMVRDMAIWHRGTCAVPTGEEEATWRGMAATQPSSRDGASPEAVNNDLNWLRRLLQNDNSSTGRRPACQLFLSSSTTLSTFYLSSLAGRPTPQPFVSKMSNQSPYTNGSSYPPPPQSQYPHSDVYKASYDDLVDEYAEPYSKTSQHQTFTPALGSAAQKPSFMAKQSYSSEMTGKDWDNESYMPSSTPRILPLKEEPVVDTRTFWQKADLFIRFLALEKSGADDDTFVTRKMPVYLGIFALAQQVSIFNALFLVYAGIQITEIQQSASELVTTQGISRIPVNILTTIIPIVISVAELVYIGLAWKIYHEFGWKVYKFLGADRRIKKMYGTYQIFQCLVKFDVFFWIGFSVQFIWLVLNPGDWEYYVTCAALPLSVVLLVEGHLAARHENKWMMLTFMSGCVSALVYFVHKLVKVIKYKRTQYTDTWKSLTTFSFISIILLLTTFFFACVVMNNFGRGLKTTMTKNKKSEHTRWGSQHMHHRAMSANPNRMSID
ncbi:hypothetical protein HWV62_30388 [Athelia sp. TMB]|nr:hypothetical protein HWV62_30388 [Athelia sp. TMB]